MWKIKFYNNNAFRVISGFKLIDIEARKYVTQGFRNKGRNERRTHVSVE